MFIILFFVIAVFTIGFFLASIFMSEGGLKKYIITSNTIILAFAITLILLFVIDAFSNMGLSEKYIVERQYILPYIYDNETEDYIIIKNIGFIDTDYYAVPKAQVEVDPACKALRQVVLYCETEGLTYGEYIDTGNGIYAYQCDSVRIMKPDYLTIVLAGVLILSVLFTINATIGMVIALVQMIIRKTKEK